MNAPVFFASAGDERGTPQGTFDALNAEFHFDLDAAASKENAKCDLWMGPGSTLAEDALTEDWGGTGFTIWLNPPYSVAGKFIKKAREEADKGATVVLLLPVRSDTKWWMGYIWDKDEYPPTIEDEIHDIRSIHRDGHWRPGTRCRFLPGRLEFELTVTVELRQWIKDQYEAAKVPLPEGGIAFTDTVKAEWYKSMVSVTGLPRMAVERILQDVPDKDLLDSAPFPSCVVIFEPVLQ